jgi:hypothetical protein
VYKVQPDTAQIMQFEDRFTAIFTQQPHFAPLSSRRMVRRPASMGISA